MKHVWEWSLGCRVLTWARWVGHGARAPWLSTQKWPPAIYALRVHARTSSHRMAEQAAAISFWALFSVFPLLLFIFSVLGLVVGAEALETYVVDYAARVLPRQVDLLRTFIHSIPGSALGVGLGTLGFLWSGARLFSALMTGLNRAHDASDAGFLKQRAVSLLLAATATVLAGATFLISYLSSLLLSAPATVLSDAWFAVLSGALSYLWMALLLFCAILFTYRFAPNLRLAWRDVWVGAVVTTVLLVLFRFAFGFYVATQDLSVYGALGAVIILLTFIYFGTQIYLLGAEINADLVTRRQSAQKR